MAKYPIRFELPKAKPMAKAPKPTASKPAAPKPPKAANTRATTQATLNRAARIQGEEARSEALLMNRRAPAKDVISVTTRMRETPPKKKR